PPEARRASIVPIILGGGGIQMPVLLQNGYIRQRLADIHVPLPEVPHRHTGFDQSLLSHDDTEIDPHGRISVQQIEHVPRQALMIRDGMDSCVKLVERRCKITFYAVFTELPFLPREDSDHTGLAVHFPDWALARRLFKIFFWNTR